MALVGLVLASASISAAFVLHIPYWYTPFTIGSFLFYDAMSERLTGRSTRLLIAHGQGRVVAAAYLVAVGLAAVVDILYGRFIAQAWVYPALSGPANFAVPVFLGYPFGAFSVYMSFQTFRGLLGAGSTSSKPLPEWWHRLSAIVLGLCFVTPILNLALNENRGATELLFMTMVVATFAFDGVHDALTGRSILGELGAGGWSYAAAVVLTVMWALVLNEGPNVFAHEWIYLVRPFGLPLWLTLVLGWFFSVSVSVAAYEVPRDWQSRRSTRVDLRIRTG